MEEMPLKLLHLQSSNKKIRLQKKKKKKEPSSLSFVNLERQTKQGQGFGSGSVLAAAHSFPAVLQLSFAGSFEVWMEKQRLTSHF